MPNDVYRWEEGGGLGTKLLGLVPRNVVVADAVA